VELTPKFRTHYVDVCTTFLTHHLADSGAKGYVVGMSGGLDSSVVAALCARAVGPKKVLGISLPDKGTAASYRRDAREWADALGLSFEEHSIDAAASAFTKSLRIPKKERRLRGNVKARVRMTMLYHLAGRDRRLVVGTGDKTELLLGYFTKMGDGGADLLPIGDLYKTQVRGMAEALDVPARIRRKKPTAGLWPGQTDEGELGMTYEDLDRVLHGVELHLTPSEIRARTRIPAKEVARIEALVEATVHKRRLPLIPKVGSRTVGLDWRE
jgi:NAD+ synthase